MPDMLSNTSCLIALDNIGQLELLRRLYGIIHISEEVAAEFGVSIPAWITVHPVQDKTKLDILHNLVDLGEASTIALAYQFDDVTLILDDRKARKLADNLNLRFTGLLGILIKAKQNGVINSVDDVLARLKAAGFRFSAVMEMQALRLAGERE
jgi:predicted nucleic acid-binding protein